MHQKNISYLQKVILIAVFLFGCHLTSSAQISPQKFGKGLKLEGKDSTFYLKFGFRFQTLYTGEWTLVDDKLSGAEDYESSFLIRRARLKFGGWAYSPKLEYKFELGLSNRDVGSGGGSEFRTAPNIVLDASVAWKFNKNFAIQFGQRKLPGNRERVISSGDLQFVDRSRLNSRFNIDRDVGLQFKYNFNAGEALIKSTFALSQGEGRNVTEGDFGGTDYTFHVDILPMGKFAGKKGDYIGGDQKREETPKLAIGLTYDMNRNAVRERGQLGSFIQDTEGNYVGRDLNTFFADLMFKYQGFSLMGEYAHKEADNNDPFVFDDSDVLIGTYYTGTGLNLQAGYLFKNNYELAVRFTDINPDAGVANDETHYTLGFSRYIVEHKLKIQTDYSLIKRDGRDDILLLRAQVDIHF